MREVVLIVDPYASLHQQEKAMWLKDHFQTICISSLEKAVEWVRTKTPIPAIMVIDAQDHEPQVPAVLQALKSVQPHLLILVLVAYGADEKGVAAVRAGACEYLCKPVSSVRLRQTLLNMLRWRGGVQAYDAPSGQNASQILAMRPPHNDVLLDEHGCVRTLHAIEKMAIEAALRHSSGCMSKAARVLGIGRSTLYRKIAEFSIDQPISRANQMTRPIMAMSSPDRS